MRVPGEVNPRCSRPETSRVKLRLHGSNPPPPPPPGRLRQKRVVLHPPSTTLPLTVWSSSHTSLLYFLSAPFHSSPFLLGTYLPYTVLHKFHKVHYNVVAEMSASNFLCWKGPLKVHLNFTVSRLCVGHFVSSFLWVAGAAVARSLGTWLKHWRVAG